MKLLLTYNSSDEGIRLIKLFKYLKYNHIKPGVMVMTYAKNELSMMSLLVSNDLDVTIRDIQGYDNIRIALKSIFPTLFDLTPTKRVSIIKKNRAKIIDMLP